jgi:hypothetical protein
MKEAILQMASASAVGQPCVASERRPQLRVEPAALRSNDGLLRNPTPHWAFWPSSASGCAFARSNGWKACRVCLVWYDPGCRGA